MDAIKQHISKDLRDEVEARKGYEKLVKMLLAQGKKREAISVRGIAKDEGDHFRILTNIMKRLG